MAKKEKKEPAKPSTAWQGTYGDMITLMLCFFVMLYDPTEVDTTALSQLQAALDIQVDSIDSPTTTGGQSLSAGRLADLGNTINNLPSAEKGRSLSIAKKKAVTNFAPEINSSKITITSDERGLIITLASDAFFEEGSAELEIDETRDILLKLSKFFQDSSLCCKRLPWPHSLPRARHRKAKHCPQNDFDGKITGHIVIGVKQNLSSSM